MILSMETRGGNRVYNETKSQLVFGDVPFDILGVADVSTFSKVHTSNDKKAGQTLTEGRQPLKHLYNNQRMKRSLNSLVRLITWLRKKSCSGNTV